MTDHVTAAGSDGQQEREAARHNAASQVGVRYLSRPASGSARRYHVRCLCGALVEASSREAVLRKLADHRAAS